MFNTSETIVKTKPEAATRTSRFTVNGTRVGLRTPGDCSPAPPGDSGRGGDNSLSGGLLFIIPSTIFWILIWFSPPSEIHRKSKHGFLANFIFELLRWNLDRRFKRKSTVAKRRDADHDPRAL
ncbi:hypothetical protein Q3G72_012301 [Acer saccharum]|nr:hypothetical protein Q3G72_012301 [Acer saccharum]